MGHCLLVVTESVQGLQLDSEMQYYLEFVSE